MRIFHTTNKCRLSRVPFAAKTCQLRIAVLIKMVDGARGNPVGNEAPALSKARRVRFLELSSGGVLQPDSTALEKSKSVGIPAR